MASTTALTKPPTINNNTPLNQALISSVSATTLTVLSTKLPSSSPTDCSRSVPSPTSTVPVGVIVGVVVGVGVPTIIVIIIVVVVIVAKRRRDKTRTDHQTYPNQQIVNGHSTNSLDASPRQPFYEPLHTVPRPSTNNQHSTAANGTGPSSNSANAEHVYADLQMKTSI
jgi:hypothetical protein